MNFWTDSVLVTCFISWFIAQFIKVVTVLIKSKRIDFRRFIGSGGMPSSHSSFVTSLTTSVAITEGFSSTAFAISVVLALVVMYDAAGVRRAAGQQAKILNKIVEEWEHADFAKTDKRLKELLGHTPFEVFAGAILGIAIAIIRHL
ncbi:MAG: divergent PAP2 family protein [Ruminococcaceae bacterium]|nr:divergent PAP2 family protein [Oscillospiraceae bacterium]